MLRHMRRLLPAAVWSILLASAGCAHPKAAERREELSRALDATEAHCLNPPARFNRSSHVPTLSLRSGEVSWPDEIEWLPAQAALPPPANQPLSITIWPAGFGEGYRNDTLV